MKKMIKETLEKKFADENCYFTMQDIHVLRKVVRQQDEEKIGITKLDSRFYKIFIKDYEHINFDMYMGKDDYFGDVVLIYENWVDNSTGRIYERKNIVWEDTLTRGWEYVTNRGLVLLGYHIANTF